jgi:hypothetical protein
MYEKEGYETAFSDELKVLPPHFDVHINLRSFYGPEVEEVETRTGGSHLDIAFDKYVRADTITTETIQLFQLSEEGEPLWDTGSIDLSVEALEPEMSTDEKLVTLVARVIPAEELEVGVSYYLMIEGPLKLCRSRDDRVLYGAYHHTA